MFAGQRVPDGGEVLARVDGNLTGVGALGVVVHSVSIGGSVSLVGGGGGTAGPPASWGACFGAATPEPWASDPSLGGSMTPVYTDFEDSSIGGNFTNSGRQSCFNGTFRNQIGGNATFVGNRMGDPDAMEVAGNVIGGDMICASNLPAVQFGDSGGSPNTVGGGWASGQCGFNVVLPKSPSEGAPGATVNTHIAVRASSLRTFIGTHVQTSTGCAADSRILCFGREAAGRVQQCRVRRPRPDRKSHRGIAATRHRRQGKSCW